MVRYVGVKHNKICVISSTIFANDDCLVLEVPKELANLSDQQLLTDCVIKNNKIVNKIACKNASQLKVAFITNWCAACGLATYSSYLLPKIADHLKDFKLFIEENDSPTGDIHQFGNKILPQDKITTCWKRGQPLNKLIEEIKKYNPDIVLIQHEFGLFPNASYWLSLMTQLSQYRIIVIMHSVFPNHLDKVVFEGSMPEIIVHLEEAKNNLVETKKVSAKVSVIPHGCYPIIDQTKLWNNYKTTHTIIQLGFGHKYKSFETTIKAVSLLKAKYSDIFFTAVFSEAPQSKLIHQAYYNELSNLIDELKLQDNVAFIRGFQSDNVVDSYLRSNQVAVFPYLSVKGHEVFGSSGSVRLAMATGLPVITSNIYHFIGTPTIKADTPEQIAAEIDKLFCNDELKKQQVLKQNIFLIENSWENIAKKYIEVFEN